MIRIEKNSIYEAKTILFFLLIGLTYVISPALTLALSFLFIVRSSKKSVILSLLFGFSLAYPALFYIPLLTDDATRIFHVVDSMKDIQLSYLVTWLQNWAQDYLNYPTFTFLMYFVARTLKTTFLSFIVAGLSYASICYAVCKFTQTFKIPNFIKGLTLVASITWISYLELISGMRFVLASCIALLIILNLFVFKKDMNYLSLLWFLIPISIHPGVLLVIIPIGLIWVIKKQSNMLVKSLLILLVMMGLVILLTGQNLQNQYIRMLLGRLTTYQNVTYGYVMAPQKIFHLVLGVTATLLSVLFLYRESSENYLADDMIHRLSSLSRIYFLYYLILLPAINLDIRLMMVMPILAILGITIKTSRYIQSDSKWAYFIIILLILLIISGAVYNISALKINFEPIPWLFPFLNSIQ